MKNRLSELAIDQIRPADKITPVIDFLHENYDIQVNELDTTKSRITSKKKEYRQQPGLVQIYLHLLSSGINISESIFLKILRDPETFPTYNPIADYFNSLKGTYKGVSHIDIFCNHLVAHDFNDTEVKDYYQKRLCKYIRKWLVSAVACALKNYANDVAMGFIHQTEGIGKTWLCKFFVPPCLADYYIKTEKDKKNFEAAVEFTRCFIVNFDEMVGIDKRSPEQFKKLLSDEMISIKRPRDLTHIKLPRIASAVFTSNKNEDMGGFITENMGYRRFLCIELNTIDKTYSEKVDIDQIYAEVVMLLEQNFEYQWTMDDFEHFKVYNSRYNIVDPVENIIHRYYSIPVNSDGSNLTTTDIFTYLTKNKRVNAKEMEKLNPRSIGIALKNIGFNRKSVRDESGKPKYMYYVKNIR